MNFLLNWTPIITTNVTAQRAYYRPKTVGGSFITTGFLPGNDLSTSADQTVTPDLNFNTVYEFKIANICSSGGPTFNNNGTQEIIIFDCDSQPVVTPLSTSALVALTSLPDDINSVKFEISGFSIITKPVVANAVSHNFTGLTPGTNYTVTITYGAEVYETQIYDTSPTCSEDFETDDLPCVAPTALVVEGQQPNLLWIGDDTICETAGGFSLLKTISGLSSPLNTWYDVTTNRVWVADQDSPLGNIYYFNPDTATTVAHMVHVGTISQNELYNNFIDADNRRIYFVGRNSGGLLVYDIDTNTTTTVAFGTNGVAFNRTTLNVFGNNIYCNIGTSGGSTNIIIIDRTTLTVTSNLVTSGIPTPGHFTGGLFTLQVANSKLYVFSNNGTLGTVGVYNLALTSHITEITLPASSVWDFGRYWQNSFYDPTSGYIFVGDIGSASRYVIDPATDTVIDTRQVSNLSGKTDAIHNFFIDPVTDNLYCSFSALNNSADGSPVQRVYLMDRTSFDYLDMYEGLYLQYISLIDGSDRVVGTNTGLPFWSGNPSYSVDGSITIYSNTAGSGNTGKLLTTTLKEVDGNNSDTPTGNTKPNIPSDIDYVAPVTNTTTCPLVFNTICPVNSVSTFYNVIDTLVFEFALPNSVINNPAVDIIEVYAYNTATLATEGSPIIFNSPFASNYFDGTITGLTAANYTIQIVYKTSPSTIIQTC